MMNRFQLNLPSLTLKFCPVLVLASIHQNCSLIIEIETQWLQFSFLKPPLTLKDLAKFFLPAFIYRYFLFNQSMGLLSAKLPPSNSSKWKMSKYVLTQYLGGLCRLFIKVMLQLTKLLTIKERAQILQASYFLYALPLPDGVLLTHLLLYTSLSQQFIVIDPSQVTIVKVVLIPY